MTIEMSNIPQERPFISFNEMFDYRFKYNSNDNLVTFAVPANKEGGGDELAYETTTFSQYENYLNWTAYMLAKHFPPRKRGQPIRIVALITGTDLDSFVNLHALFRLGHGVLILSPNNSIEGMIHLTKKMSCTDVIFSLENREIAQELKRTYQEEENTNLFTTSWVMVKVIKHQSAPPPQLIRTELSYEEESKDFSTILHSSGSTNLPKPLPMSHKAWLNHLFGKDFGGTSIYPFNHFSGTQTIFLSFQNLRETVLMSSRVPYTSSNLVKIIKNALEGGSQQLLCVPLTLKLLSEISNGINLLAKFQLVSYAGSVCPKPLGDHLIENGVNLQTFYGATETGLCLSTFRDFEKDKGWDIMRPIKEIIPFARWEEQEDDPGMYELVIEKGFPSLSAANRPDGAYATSDLFTKHPTMPNGFYYASRKDDSLVHVHGKKTNPLLIETDLRSSPLIKDAMVFGANRMQTGCLIIPQSDDLTLENLRDAIDFANKRAPTWSRLENEMVIVLPSSEKFVMTDKLSLIRAKTNKKFEKLIEEKYNNVERNFKGQELEKVKLKTLTQALLIVQTIVSEVMKAQITHLGSIKEDDNLFDKGLDSLAVMRIGSLIRSRVEFPMGIEANETAAFHYPTIRTLAEYLYRLSSGANQQNEDDEDANSLNLMRRLLNKYTERIETRSASTVAQVKNGKETILLTGATGSLGAHLFSIAAKRQDVEAIICLCRAKTDEEALERVNASLAERRLPAIRHFASNCKILCLSSDLADAHLGLAPEVYDSILQSVTSIVHAAWPVNFSMGVSAFESSLQGCVNLINLASKSSLAHPPQLIFCSSIAAASFHNSGKEQNAVMEEPSIDPKDAVPNGYGRSKWIAEALFDAAAIKITNLNSKIIRIGQLSGDLQNGIWNEKEAYPLLIKTAQTIGSLPDLSNQQLYWLPVDIAAEMIVEVAMQTKDERGTRIVHVASQEVTNWNQIVLAVRHAYPKVRQVPFVRWLEELRTAKDQNPKSNPAIKLLDYYATWLNMKQGGIPRFDAAYVNNLLTDKPQILKHSGALSKNNLTKMISAWQQNGFLIHA